MIAFRQYRYQFLSYDLPLIPCHFNHHQREYSTAPKSHEIIDPKQKTIDVISHNESVYLFRARFNFIFFIRENNSWNLCLPKDHFRCTTVIYDRANLLSWRRGRSFNDTWHWDSIIYCKIPRKCLSLLLNWESVEKLGDALCSSEIKISGKSKELTTTFVFHLFFFSLFLVFRQIINR